MIRRLLVLAAACLGLALAPPGATAAVVLPDSTFVDGWRLDNGLEVRVRHIPGAAGVVITTAYRSGSLDDPAGREGLAELLSDLQYYSPAGQLNLSHRFGWKSTLSQPH